MTKKKCYFSGCTKDADHEGPCTPPPVGKIELDEKGKAVVTNAEGKTIGRQG